MIHCLVSLFALIVRQDKFDGNSMASVSIPSLMRDLTGGLARVEAPGRTVAEVVDALDAAYPGVKARLCEGSRLLAGLAVSVDGKLTRLGLQQPVGRAVRFAFCGRRKAGKGIWSGTDGGFTHHAGMLQSSMRKRDSLR
jgi:molybdopterin converting factor small subunit